MEQLMSFNGVKVLFTTGQSLREIQAGDWIEQADLILSIYKDEVRVLKHIAKVVISV